jgi:hypothetical protein
MKANTRDSVARFTLLRVAVDVTRASSTFSSTSVGSNPESARALSRAVASHPPSCYVSRAIVTTTRFGAVRH